MHTNNRLQLRIIASTLCVAFLCRELSAAPLDVPITLSAQETILKDPRSFEAPVRFATLNDIHTGDKGVFIIHIQDAHSNFSGQENLANALSEIMDRYDVQLVLSEGGWGDCSLTPMKKIASTAVWKKVARRFLVSGELQGEEYLNLISDRPMKILGIEKADLYNLGLADYQELAEKREEVLTYLEKSSRAVQKIKSKLYPRELLDYERTPSQNFEEKFRKLFVIARSGEAATKQSNIFPDFPALQKLIQLQEKEKNVNFDAANLELAALVEEIAQRGGKETLEDYLEKAGQMQGAKLAQFTYFQNTLNIAKEKGVAVDKFENLNTYVDYLGDFSALDFDAILQELPRAEDAVYHSVIARSSEAATKQSMATAEIASGTASPRNDTEDALLIRSIDRFLQLLSTAHQIQMTSDQYKLFTYNEPDFSTEATQAFLNRKLAELGYYEDLIPFEPLLADGRDALGAFYDSVKKRDFAFIENVEEALRTEKQKVAVLITGGYHTSHLKKLLQEKGYGYAVLTPIVTSETSQKKYEKLLLSQRSEKKKTVTLSEGQTNRKDRSLGALDGDLAGLVRKKTEKFRVQGTVVEATTRGFEGSRLAKVADAAKKGSSAELPNLFSASVSALQRTADPGARMVLEESIAEPLTQRMRERGVSARLADEGRRLSRRALFGVAAGALAAATAKSQALPPMRDQLERLASTLLGDLEELNRFKAAQELKEMLRQNRIANAEDRGFALSVLLDSIADPSHTLWTMAAKTLLEYPEGVELLSKKGLTKIKEQRAAVALRIKESASSVLPPMTEQKFIDDLSLNPDIPQDEKKDLEAAIRSEIGRRPSPWAVQYFEERVASLPEGDLQNLHDLAVKRDSDYPSELNYALKQHLAVNPLAEKTFAAAPDGSGIKLYKKIQINLEDNIQLDTFVSSYRIGILNENAQSEDIPLVWQAAVYEKLLAERKNAVPALAKKTGARMALEASLSEPFDQRVRGSRLAGQKLFAKITLATALLGSYASQGALQAQQTPVAAPKPVIIQNQDLLSQLNGILRRPAPTYGEMEEKREELGKILYENQSQIETIFERQSDPRFKEMLVDAIDRQDWEDRSTKLQLLSNILKKEPDRFVIMFLAKALLNIDRNDTPDLRYRPLLRTAVQVVEDQILFQPLDASVRRNAIDELAGKRGFTPDFERIFNNLKGVTHYVTKQGQPYNDTLDVQGRVLENAGKLAENDGQIRRFLENVLLGPAEDANLRNTAANEIFKSFPLDRRAFLFEQMKNDRSLSEFALLVIRRELIQLREKEEFDGATLRVFESALINGDGAERLNTRSIVLSEALKRLGRNYASSNAVRQMLSSVESRLMDSQLPADVSIASRIKTALAGARLAMGEEEVLRALESLKGKPFLIRFTIDGKDGTDVGFELEYSIFSERLFFKNAGEDIALRTVPLSAITELRQPTRADFDELEERERQEDERRSAERFAENLERRRLEEASRPAPRATGPTLASYSYLSQSDIDAFIRESLRSSENTAWGGRVLVNKQVSEPDKENMVIGDWTPLEQLKDKIRPDGKGEIVAVNVEGIPQLVQKETFEKWRHANDRHSLNLAGPEISFRVQDGELLFFDRDGKELLYRSGDKQKVVVGKGEDVDFRVQTFIMTSRRHVEFSRTSEGWELKDLSSNGTQLDGSALTPQVPVAVTGGQRMALAAVEFPAEVRGLDLNALPIRDAVAEIFRYADETSRESGVVIFSDNSVGKFTKGEMTGVFLRTAGTKGNMHFHPLSGNTAAGAFMIPSIPDISAPGQELVILLWGNEALGRYASVVDITKIDVNHYRELSAGAQPARAMLDYLIGQGALSLYRVDLNGQTGFTPIAIEEADAIIAEFEKYYWGQIKNLEDKEYSEYRGKTADEIDAAIRRLEKQIDAFLRVAKQIHAPNYFQSEKRAEVNELLRKLEARSKGLERAREAAGNAAADGSRLASRYSELDVDLAGPLVDTDPKLKVKVRRAVAVALNAIAEYDPAQYEWRSREAISSLHAGILREMAQIQRITVASHTDENSPALEYSWNKIPAPDPRLGEFSPEEKESFRLEFDFRGAESAATHEDSQFVAWAVQALASFSDQSIRTPLIAAILRQELPRQRLTDVALRFLNALRAVTEISDDKNEKEALRLLIDALADLEARRIDEALLSLRQAVEMVPQYDEAKELAVLVGARLALSSEGKIALDRLLSAESWTAEDNERFSDVMLKGTQEIVNGLSRETQKNYRDYSGPAYDAAAFLTAAFPTGLRKVIEELFGLDQDTLMIPMRIADIVDKTEQPGSYTVHLFGLPAADISYDQSGDSLDVRFLLNRQDMLTIRNKLLDLINNENYLKNWLKLTDIQRKGLDVEVRFPETGTAEDRTVRGSIQELAPDAVTIGGQRIQLWSVRDITALTDAGSRVAMEELARQALRGEVLKKLSALQKNITTPESPLFAMFYEAERDIQKVVDDPSATAQEAIEALSGVRRLSFEALQGDFASQYAPFIIQGSDPGTEYEFHFNLKPGKALEFLRGVQALTEAVGQADMFLRMDDSISGGARLAADERRKLESEERNLKIEIQQVESEWERLDSQGATVTQQQRLAGRMEQIRARLEEIASLLSGSRPAVLETVDLSRDRYTRSPANEVIIYKPKDAADGWWIKRLNRQNMLFARNEHVTAYAQLVNELRRKLAQDGSKPFEIVEMELVRVGQNEFSEDPVIPGELALKVRFVPGTSLKDVLERIRRSEPEGDAEYRRLFDGVFHPALDWMNAETGGLADIHEIAGRPDYLSTLQNFQVRAPDLLDGAGVGLRPEAYGKAVPVIIDPLSFPRLQEKMAQEAVMSKLSSAGSLTPAQQFVLNYFDKNFDRNKMWLLPVIEDRLLRTYGEVPTDPEKIIREMASVLIEKRRPLAILELRRDGDSVVAEEKIDTERGEKILDSMRVGISGGSSAPADAELLDLFLAGSRLAAAESGKDWLERTPQERAVWEDAIRVKIRPLIQTKSNVMTGELLDAYLQAGDYSWIRAELTITYDQLKENTLPVVGGIFFDRFGKGRQYLEIIQSLRIKDSPWVTDLAGQLKGLQDLEDGSAEIPEALQRFDTALNNYQIQGKISEYYRGLMASMAPTGARLAELFEPISDTQKEESRVWDLIRQLEKDGYWVGSALGNRDSGQYEGAIAQSIVTAIILEGFRIREDALLKQIIKVLNEIALRAVNTGREMSFWNEYASLFKRLSDSGDLETALTRTSEFLEERLSGFPDGSSSQAVEPAFKAKIKELFDDLSSLPESAKLDVDGAALIDLGAPEVQAVLKGTPIVKQEPERVPTRYTDKRLLEEAADRRAAVSEGMREIRTMADRLGAIHFVKRDRGGAGYAKEYFYLDTVDFGLLRTVLSGHPLLAEIVQKAGDEYRRYISGQLYHNDLGSSNFRVSAQVVGSSVEVQFTPVDYERIEKGSRLAEEVTSASKQGKRSSQQDRYLDTRIELDGVLHGKGRLLIVADGHGDSAETAEKIIAQLPGFFLQSLQANASDVEVHQVEQVFIKDVLEETFDLMAAATQEDGSGSTAIVAYIPDDENRVYVAGLGDSRAIVRTRDGSVFEAVRHNIRSNMTERKAVIARGGAYLEKGYVHDPEIGTRATQLSRAFGDKLFDRILSRKLEPDDIKALDIGPDSFIFLASDGLDRLDQDMIEQEMAQGADAEWFVDKALSAGTGDNVTAIVWRRGGSRLAEAKAHLEKLGVRLDELPPDRRPAPIRNGGFGLDEGSEARLPEVERALAEKVKLLSRVLKEPIGIHVMAARNIDHLLTSPFDGTAVIISPFSLEDPKGIQSEDETALAYLKRFMEELGNPTAGLGTRTPDERQWMGIEPGQPSLPLALFIRTKLESGMRPLDLPWGGVVLNVRRDFEHELAAAVHWKFEEIDGWNYEAWKLVLAQRYLDKLLEIAQAAPETGLQPAEKRQKSITPFDEEALESLERGVLENLAIRLARDNRRLSDENAQLRERVFMDSLTGLKNRAYLDEYLPMVLELAARNGMPVSLIAMDLDKFKEINDVNGHEVGDEVLRYTGRVLRNTVLREHDHVFEVDNEPMRAGGEEFFIVLPGTDAEGAVIVATRIQEAFEKRLDWQTEGAPASPRTFTIERPDEKDGYITASLGVVQLRPGEGAVDLKSRADEALYKAKDFGRNRVVLAEISGSRLATEFIKARLANPSERPDPMEIRRVLAAENLPIDDIERLIAQTARETGGAVPQMSRTLEETRALVPYIAKLVTAIHERAQSVSNPNILFLGRDAELLYDAYRVLFEGAGAEHARLVPGSKPLWRGAHEMIVRNFQDGRSQPDETAIRLTRSFLADHGISEENIDAQTIIFVDTGFVGTVPAQMTRILQKLFTKEMIRPITLLVSAIGSRNGQELTLPVDKAEYEKLQETFARKSGKFPAHFAYSAGSVNYLLATSMQLMPRYYGTYAGLEEQEGRIVALTRNEPVRDNVDAVENVNDSVVNPVAALTVQMVLIRALMADVKLPSGEGSRLSTTLEGEDAQAEFAKRFGDQQEKVLEFLGVPAGSPVVSYSIDLKMDPYQTVEKQTREHSIDFGQGLAFTFFTKEYLLPNRTFDREYAEATAAYHEGVEPVGPKTTVLKIPSTGKQILLSLKMEGQSLDKVVMTDKVAAALGRSLALLHSRGVIHGDLARVRLKPEHTYVQGDVETEPVVAFIDFGFDVAKDRSFLDRAVREMTNVRVALLPAFRTPFAETYRQVFKEKTTVALPSPTDARRVVRSAQGSRLAVEAAPAARAPADETAYSLRPEGLTLPKGFVSRTDVLSDERSLLLLAGVPSVSAGHFFFSFQGSRLALVGVGGGVVQFVAPGPVFADIPIPESVLDKAMDEKLFGSAPIRGSELAFLDESDLDRNKVNVRAVIRTALRIAKLTNYDAQKTVEFRYWIPAGFTDEQAADLNKWAQLIAAKLGGQVLIQFGTRTEDFADLSGGKDQKEHAIVDMGKLSQDFLENAKGHGIASTLLDGEESYLPSFFNQMVFSVVLQRLNVDDNDFSKVPIDLLQQMWSNLRGYETTDLDVDALKDLRQVGDKPDLRRYQDLVFRVMKAAWREAIQSTWDALQAVGFAA